MVKCSVEICLQTHGNDEENRRRTADCSGDVMLQYTLLVFRVFFPQLFFFNIKGQLISKADWRAIDSPNKRTDEFVLFAFLLFTANKSNSSVRFLGESTSHICFSILSDL